MIVSADGEHLVSFLPWQDRGRLTVCDGFDFARTRRLKIGRILARDFDRPLGPAADGYFWVVTGTSLLDKTPCLSVRTLSDTAPEVYRLRFTLDEEQVDLPREYLGGAERHWVGRYGGRWQTFIATPEDSVVASYPCAWRGRNPGDRKAPGFSGVWPVPGRNELWYAVDRSDHLLVVDSRTMQDLGTVRLPRAGCRQILFGTDGLAFVQNFDTVAVVDTGTREVLRESRLQPPDWDDRGQKFAVFIGELLLMPDGRRLCVARPFSSDIVVVDVETLEKRQSIPLRGEPLELALHPNGNDLLVREAWAGEFLRCTVD
jgi:hypothetical protein